MQSIKINYFSLLTVTISMYCLVGLVLGEIIFRVYDIYTNYVRGQNIYEHIRRNQPNYQCYTLLVTLFSFLFTKWLHVGLHITVDGIVIIISNVIFHWMQKHFNIVRPQVGRLLKINCYKKE